MIFKVLVISCVPYWGRVIPVFAWKEQTTKPDRSILDSKKPPKTEAFEVFLFGSFSTDESTILKSENRMVFKSLIINGVPYKKRVIPVFAWKEQWGLMLRLI